MEDKRLNFCTFKTDSWKLCQNKNKEFRQRIGMPTHAELVKIMKQQYNLRNVVAGTDIQVWHFNSKMNHSMPNSTELQILNSTVKYSSTLSRHCVCSSFSVNIIRWIKKMLDITALNEEAAVTVKVTLKVSFKWRADKVSVKLGYSNSSGCTFSQFCHPCLYNFF